MGTEYICQVLDEALKVSLVHARAHDVLIKARSGPEEPWRGPCMSCSYTSEQNSTKSPGSGSNDHQDHQNPYYGTTNLRKRAETRGRVVTNIQNFALRARDSL